MSKRERAELDPGNIIPPGPRGRTVRSSCTHPAGDNALPDVGNQRQSSPPVMENAKPTAKSVREPATPEGEFYETPIGVGRLSGWRDGSLMNKVITTMKGLVASPKGTETVLDMLVTVRQDVERYCDHLTARDEWPTLIEAEAHKTLKQLELLNCKAADDGDADVVRECETLTTHVHQARASWRRYAATSSCAPPPQRSTLTPLTMAAPRLLFPAAPVEPSSVLPTAASSPLLHKSYGGGIDVSAQLQEALDTGGNRDSPTDTHSSSEIELDHRRISEGSASSGTLQGRPEPAGAHVSVSTDIPPPSGPGVVNETPHEESDMSQRSSYQGVTHTASPPRHPSAQPSNSPVEASSGPALPVLSSFITEGSLSLAGLRRFDLDLQRFLTHVLTISSANTQRLTGMERDIDAIADATARLQGTTNDYATQLVQLDAKIDRVQQYASDLRTEIKANFKQRTTETASSLHSMDKNIGILGQAVTAIRQSVSEHAKSISGLVSDVDSISTLARATRDSLRASAPPGRLEAHPSALDPPTSIPEPTTRMTCPPATTARASSTLKVRPEPPTILFQREASKEQTLSPPGFPEPGKYQSFEFSSTDLPPVHPPAHTEPTAHVNSSSATLSFHLDSEGQQKGRPLGGNPTAPSFTDMASARQASLPALPQGHYSCGPPRLAASPPPAYSHSAGHAASHAPPAFPAAHAEPELVVPQPGSRLLHALTPVEESVLQDILDDLKYTSEDIHSIVDQPVPTDISELNPLRADSIPTLRDLTKSLTRTLERLAKEFPGREALVRKSAAELLRTAQRWVLRVQESFKDADGHTLGDKRFVVEVKKYTKAGTETVYDFFESFELAYKGASPKERARMLVKSYLDTVFIDEVKHLEDDYVSIKNWLVTRMGREYICTTATLRKLAGKVNPKDDRGSNVTRLATINGVIRDLLKNAERKHPTVCYEEFMSAYAKSDVIGKLLACLTPREKTEFRCRLIKHGLDAEFMHGVEVFDQLVSFVKFKFTLYSADENSAPPTEKDRKKDPKALGAPKTASFADEPSAQVFAASFTLETNWYTPGLEKPCGIQGHGSHEAGSCQEFLSLGAKERRAHTKFRACWTCLAPSHLCQSPAGQCRNQAAVREFLCLECDQLNRTHKKRNHLSPLSIIMCSNPKHKKPSKDEISRILTKFLPGFASAHEDLFVFHCAARQAYGAVTAREPISKSSPPSTEPENCINTTSGEVKDLDLSLKIPESKDSPIYLVQLMRFRDRIALVFFDTGANLHLIDGAFAESLGIQVVSQKPIMFRAAGDAEVFTEYGLYRLNIGPTMDDKYHEILAYGVSPVTGEFPRFDFERINTEVIESGTLEEHVPLPKYTGGSRVHLLIGIKNTAAQPKLIAHLGGGLSVYESPFPDMFGSRICYGGTHESLSAQSGTTNYASSYFLSALRAAGHQLASTADKVEECAMEALSPGKATLSQRDPDIIYPTDAKLFCDSGVIYVDTSAVLSEVPDADRDQHCSHCTVVMAAHKAMIPIQRLRELADQDDKGDLVTYRCPTCSSCERCKASTRMKARTRQEEVEQEVIERSVDVDWEQGKVFVTLPFVKDPVKALTHRHGSDNNYSQAIRVYKQQTRKPDQMKRRIAEAHQDLVDKGFMKKLTDLDPLLQDRIATAPFKHYYPWRAVFKDGSQSTPCRLVVDPTMSGLNLILAKGEGGLQNLTDILIRSRTRKHIWSSDISKMYNCLHLTESSLPYSLFLFGDLDAATPPDVYVMLVAWYGVVPTGNQACYAIETIANAAPQDADDAKDALLYHRYVDDILSGADDEEGREAQIAQVQELLGTGGFKLKFVARSGTPPCDKASANGIDMKVLGYNWRPEHDLLSPGMGELNFNKRIRGSRQPNDTPVTSVDDALKLMSSVVITRRICVSKVAEFFDPQGIWEPIKLEFKLELAKLAGYDWDEPLPTALQDQWKRKLTKVVDLPMVTVRRSVIPDHVKVNTAKARLLVLVDAAEHAGGAAVYIGYELPDGSFSCSLLTSKSRVMSGTVPRNELSALLLGAELAFTVCKALPHVHFEVIFMTDSTVALSWTFNTEKRLKMYVYNRVTSIVRLIEWTVGPTDTLPIFHIPGDINLADLLTKFHDLHTSDIGRDSAWQNGHTWMQLPTPSLPVTTYADISEAEVQESMEYTREYYNDPHTFVAQETLSFGISDSVMSHMSREIGHVLQAAQEQTETPPPPVSTAVIGCQDEWTDMADQMLDLVTVGSVHMDQALEVYVMQTDKWTTPDYLGINIIKLGWPRSLRLMTMVVKCALRWYMRLKSKTPLADTARYALSETTARSDKARSLRNIAIEVFARCESACFAANTTLDARKDYILSNGIYYYSGRITAEHEFVAKDLDFEIIPDSMDFCGLTPILLPKSPLTFAYVFYIHQYVREHAGTETILREVLKRFHITGHQRYVISKIRRDCAHCRSILRKTVELELAKIHPARLTLAPVFYQCMCDIAYGPFKAQPFKRSRTKMTVYALVIVCMLTSATNMLVLEGIETQDVVACFERHGCRYGFPAEIFVDPGSQLCALQAMKVTLRDADTVLYDARGVTITVSAPKAHESRGRVERKIRTIRDMLTRLNINTHDPVSTLTWETVFSKVANAIDDIPVALGNNSNVTDIGREIITPNRLKLGRNNNRSLQSTIELSNTALPCDILNRNRKLTCSLLAIVMERVHHLVTSWKGVWRKTDKRLPQVGDIVLFRFSDNDALSDAEQWRLGRILSTTPTRSTILYTVKSEGLAVPKGKTLERSHRSIVILFSENDPDVNSEEYFKKNIQCHE